MTALEKLAEIEAEMRRVGKTFHVSAMSNQISLWADALRAERERLEPFLTACAAFVESYDNPTPAEDITRMRQFIAAYRTVMKEAEK